MAAQALKDKQDIERVYRETLKHGQIWADLLTLGLRTGLRNGDLRELTFDCIDWDNRTMTVTEGKYTKAKATKTRRQFIQNMREAFSRCGSLTKYLKLNDNALSEIREAYAEAMATSPAKVRTIYLDDTCYQILKRRFEKWATITNWVFTSRDTRSNNKRVDQHVSRSAQSQIAAKVKAVLNSSRMAKGLRAIQYSLHSTRKTAGYILYKATNDIEKVAQFLRHESSATTRRYIGLDQDTEIESFNILSKAFSL